MTKQAPPDGSRANDDARRPLREMGEFLRQRRSAADRANTPFGALPGHHKPGLRREEVAALAGISADWYGRLELGYPVHPSPATLLAIAAALGLSEPETTYVFEMANVAPPKAVQSAGMDVPEALSGIITTVQGAATLFDCYMTPLMWNATAAGLFGYDASSAYLQRNLIVRGLIDPSFISVFGDDFDTVAMRVVGLFRQSLARFGWTRKAMLIHSFAIGFDHYRECWKEQVIASSFTPSGPFFRHHPAVGAIQLDSADLGVRDDLFLRVLTGRTPADVSKIAQLGTLGSDHLTLDISLD